MKKRHVVLTLLVLLSTITYFDRICIAVAGPRIQAEMGLTPTQWGWVLNAFVLAYGLFEIPGGALGDRFGHRRVIMRIVVWWSVFTSLTGLAWNYLSLLTTRFLFGAGEAGAYPNMAGSVGRWFPRDERARAQGFIWSASRIGGALSPIAVVPLMALVGWRATFVIFGAIGIVWAVVWFAWYRDHPAEQPGITADELAEIGGGSESAVRVVIPWARLFRHPQLWLIMAMYWSYVWGAIFFMTWFPTYLVKGRGLTEREMGYCAALPFILGAAGNLAGGWLCDRLSRRFGFSVGRRLVGTGALLGSALLLAAVALTTGKVTGVVLLALGLGVMDCMLPAAWAISLDVGGRFSGAVSGAMNTAGQFGGVMCIQLFGYLVEKTGDYNQPILLIAALVVLSAFLFWKIDPTRRLVDETATAEQPATAESR